MLLNCVAVGVGGFLGSVLRYLTGQLPLGESGLFPARTFLVNLLGCAVIGCLAFSAERNTSLDPRLLLLWKTGFCGGFTTFSTFALETTELLEGGHMGLAVLYVVLSAVLGVGLVFGVQIMWGK